MKLSILILTHNRPELFKRCLNSILSKNFNYEVQILVNNDSYDIKEIYDNNICIKYFYLNSPDNLGKIYNFLYEQAQGEYIYFLEDDDYLTHNGLLNIDFKHDLYYMNYIGVDKNKTIKRINTFEIEQYNKDFQLSQILFKKDLLISGMFYYRNNYIHNDWKLFQELINNTNNIKLIKNPQFIQTIDGKDNISFKKYNKDRRWNSFHNQE